MVSEGLAGWIHEFRGLTETKVRVGVLPAEQEARWNDLRLQLTEQLTEIAEQNIPEDQRRRRALRAPVHCAVTFWYRGRSYRARGSELSAKGLLVRTRQPPPQGSVLQLALEIPFNSESLLLRAEVAWVSPPSTDPPMPPGMGVSFLDIEPEVADILESAVLSELGAECLRGRLPTAISEQQDPRSRILLVDDDMLFLSMQGDILTEAGYAILTAKRAEEGLEVVLDADPSVVLLDLNLPDMNGDECCQVLKANASTCFLPVLMVTSSDRLEDVRRCFEAGCDDYLVKPVSREELVGKVQVAAVGPGPDNTEPLPDTAKRRPRVLLAEDSRFFRAALSGTLVRSGYDVVTAEDGFEALRIYLEQIATIQAAVVDLKLPGLDGFQVIEKIRATPVGHDLPILAISAIFRDPKAVDRMRHAGALGFLPKDKNVDDIVFRLHNLMQRVPEDFTGYPNVPFFAPVRYREPGESIDWGGYGFGLRPDGMYLRTIAPKPIHTQLEMVFDLEAQGRIEVKGKVLWARHFGGPEMERQPPGMAVAFQELSAKSAAAIQDFVSTNLVVG